MQVCEVIYGCERGAEVRAFLESAMGQPCPCRRDEPCPLMPNDDSAAVTMSEVVRRALKAYLR